MRRIIDVRDPNHPVEAGVWKLHGQPLIPPLKWKQWFFEWLNAGTQGTRLLSFDMDDPLHPREAGSLTLPAGLPALFGASVTNGKRLFALADNGIVAIDVSDPAAMRVIGSYMEKGIGNTVRYSWQGSGRRAALHGDFLYVIQGSEALDSPHIAVINVSDPARMHKVFTTPDTVPTFEEDWFDQRLLHQGDMLNDMLLRGEQLYVSDYWGGVRIYDCSTPFRPQLSHWEFQPYLALMAPGWSREGYRKAVASGRLHTSLGLDHEQWEQRHAIGQQIWHEPLEYHPGYDLFGWNIGGFAGNYLLQPKLGGIAVYRLPSTDRSEP